MESPLACFCDILLDFPKDLAVVFKIRVKIQMLELFILGLDVKTKITRCSGESIGAS